MVWLEIQFWKIAKWIIKKGYGASCPEYVKGCGSCEAEKVLIWINGHIDLLENWQ